MRFLLLCLSVVAFSIASASASTKPNIVIIFLDDAGYADFRPFGGTDYPTPHVERLAKQGVRLNQFYVPTAVCSASRSSLLTGLYASSHGVFGAHPPGGRGLEPKFMTLAELLNREGYATAHFGKWHVGDQPDTRPTARGFDTSAGLMFSNDMWRFNPIWQKRRSDAPMPFWRDGAIEIQDVLPEHQKLLTKWATEDAVKFIEEQKDSPFFLYVAHSMPHVPLYVSDAFLGKSGAGLYADVMMELDWSVGQILGALEAGGVAENTIVIFSSDNGPWEEYGNHAGKTPFREHKGTSFDGGTRSATIIAYPDRLEAGRVLDRPFSTIDIFPTLAHLIGAKLPDYPLDGMNIWPLLVGDEGVPHPHDFYFVEYAGRLTAIQTTDGRWKLFRPHRYRHVVEPGQDGARGKTTRNQIEWALFDLDADPFETSNVIEAYPELVEVLKARAEAHRVRSGLK